MGWLKIVLLFISQIFLTVIGWFILPFFMTRIEPFECVNIDSRPNARFKDKWIDAIFGNVNDGNEGDAPYKAKYKSLSWWTRYNWCAFRNPVNNLKLFQGVDEVITDYYWDGYRYTEDRIGREGFVISYAAGESGKVYPMLRWCKLWFKDYGIECNIGYKNFNIEQFPKHYKYSVTISINPFKKFER